MNNLGYTLNPTDEQLKCLEMRAHEQELISPERLRKLRDVANTTLVQDRTGLIVAMIGYLTLWPGVIEVFVIPSIHVHKYPIAFVKNIRGWLVTLRENAELHRIQTSSLADEATDRWMRCMGFVCEGTLVGYTEKRHDYRMWRHDGN